ncbi:MAG TPA: shikimate dehydrogenase [Alphaproteobacteria bacterium]|nr:shikimate dehydrogenase [Alphaproteobacteria bacterium]
MKLSGKARLAGVMGWPVAHSRSPLLHGYWLEHYGIDGAYVPLAVAPEHFAQALRALSLMGFGGVNVTLPHKEAALAAVDEATATARRIGAVNTVTMRPDGSLLGDNTDAFGFIESLRQSVPDWQPEAGPALLLGAGGTARAVAVALLEAGLPEITLVNRTTSRAEGLALELGALDLGGAVKVGLWVDRARLLGQVALLVNTSSLGLAGGPALDLDLTALAPEAVVADVVYTPLETPLLRDAAVRGNAVVDGLGMLLHQARPGFAAWFGTAPEVSASLRELLVADIAATS